MDAAKSIPYLKIHNGGFIMNDNEQKEALRLRGMHSHEICFSLESAGMDRHTHRGKAMLFDVMPTSCGGHRHRFSFSTDFFGHNHRITGECGPAVFVGNGKHIHFISGNTSCGSGHSHRYQFSTSIDCAGNNIRC